MRKCFLFIIIFLSVSLLLTGCHSYYLIPKDDYNKIEAMEDIKIVYTNGKEFVVEKDDTTHIKIVGDSLVVYQGAEKKIVGMNEIEKIKESRFDLGGTITLSISALTFLMVIFFSSLSFKT